MDPAAGDGPPPKPRPRKGAGRAVAREGRKQAGQPKWSGGLQNSSTPGTSPRRRPRRRRGRLLLDEAREGRAALAARAPPLHSGNVLLLLKHVCRVPLLVRRHGEKGPVGLPRAAAAARGRARRQRQAARRAPGPRPRPVGLALALVARPRLGNRHGQRARHGTQRGREGGERRREVRRAQALRLSLLGRTLLLSHEETNQEVVANVEVKLPAVSWVLPVALASGSVVEVRAVGAIPSRDRAHPLGKHLRGTVLRLRQRLLNSRGQHIQRRLLSLEEADQGKDLAERLNKWVLPRRLVLEIVVEVEGT
mmetsp:Transcript_50287/g.145819  ORF Transcript_50287/g.145819 Transcript_50287/m.145819 type:complete len:308 (+) Transcript_50287:49-972(+)